MSLRTVRIGSLNLNVYDRGRGTPVLLVHGFPLDHSMWSCQLAALAAAHRVIAPDLRGFGGSDVSPGTVTMEQFADDCAALLDALEIHEPIAFCGLSMGGYIGWAFLRKHAARVNRLVLCDTRAAADTPEAAETRRKMADHVLAHGNEALATAMLPKLFAKATFARRPEIVDQVRRAIAAAPPQGAAAAQRGMALRPDVSAELASIRQPTLVIVGEEDAISTAAEMSSFASSIPGAELLLVPDAGHMAPLENPAIVNPALLRFLR